MPEKPSVFTLQHMVPKYFSAIS